MSVVVRGARADDAEFLVEAAIQADKSGGGVSSYETLFGLAGERRREALLQMFAEDVAGQELCVSDAVIAEVDGQRAGTLVSWVEGEEGLESAMAKAAVLFSTLGEAIEREARPKLAPLGELAIARAAGTLQLESIYVAPSFRGSGVLGAMFSHVISERGQRATDRRAQILLLGRNEAAKRAYTKQGFAVVETRTGQDPRLVELIGDDSRILMERPLA